MPEISISNPGIQSESNHAPPKKLEIHTGYGPVYRDILPSPPRRCTPEEVPVIDLAGIYGGLEDRQAVAEIIYKVATGMGFFYVKNHGISEEVIQKARSQCYSFFEQPEEMKIKVGRHHSDYFNGFVGMKKTRLSASESDDWSESLTWRYDPKYDPLYQGRNVYVPPDVGIRGEDFVWEGTSHLPRFKEDIFAYYNACLALSRRMIRIFALSLDLPEDYFDATATFPGADMTLNWYPPFQTTQKKDDVGLGSHTDKQSFTLLWQDNSEGLQVLSNEGQWLELPYIDGTMVVNIGDFLMRLTNDKFQSTVHRVFHYGKSPRMSMPFFFGFNFNQQCAVLPSCTSAEEPAKYEPISCGEYCQLYYVTEVAATKARAAQAAVVT